MKLAFCIDNQGGLTFFGKRLSRDHALIRTLQELCPTERILFSPQSQLLFEENERFIASDSYLTMATEGDICWVEFDEIPLEKAEEVLLFCWNRKYPADRFFQRVRLEESFVKTKFLQFQGSSHDKITLEIFRRKTR